MWSRLVDLLANKSRAVNDVPPPESLLVSGRVDEDHHLDKTIASYTHQYDDPNKDDEQRVLTRQHDYAWLVKEYYNLASDFYEYGWGESFHFSTRFQGETFEAALARHEHFLAAQLGLHPGMRALDVGCGIGGPMRAIVRFTGAHVTGVTINAYQVKRAQYLNRAAHLDQLTQVVIGDFQNLHSKHNNGVDLVGKFDAAYAIEATCHSPDRVVCFKQVFDALKPGGVFAVYEWCMTPAYDASNPTHRDIKHEIERGNALPTLPMQDEVVNAFTQAGFRVLDARDLHVSSLAMLGPHQSVPWYSTLQGGMSWTNWRHSRAGRRVSQAGVDLLEFLHIAPRGVGETHRMLCRAADSLAVGGALGIFTPMFLVVGRKE